MSKAIRGSSHGSSSIMKQESGVSMSLGHCKGSVISKDAIVHAMCMCMWCGYGERVEYRMVLGILRGNVS